MKVKINYREQSSGDVAEVGVEGEEDPVEIKKMAAQLFEEAMEYSKIKSIQKTRR